MVCIKSMLIENKKDKVKDRIFNFGLNYASLGTTLFITIMISIFIKLNLSVNYFLVMSAFVFVIGIGFMLGSNAIGNFLNKSKK